MASEQIMSEAITRAVAETTRIALQTMVEAQVEIMQRFRNQGRWFHHEANNI